MAGAVTNRLAVDGGTNVPPCLASATLGVRRDWLKRGRDDDDDDDISLLLLLLQNRKGICRVEYEQQRSVRDRFEIRVSMQKELLGDPRHLHSLVVHRLLATIQRACPAGSW